MKQKEIPYKIRIRMQQAKSNSYHCGYSDGYREAMKLVKDPTIYAPSVKQIVENCDLAVKNIDNHYRYIIASLDKKKNNQFTDIVLFWDPESIQFDVDEMEYHNKLEVGIAYRHSESSYCASRIFPLGYEMSIEELLKLYNQLLEQMIKKHSREVDDGNSKVDKDNH